MRRSSLFGFDIILLSSTFLLVILGIFFIFSSGVTATGEIYSTEYIKQIVWAVTGLIWLLFLTFSNYRNMKNLAPTIYIIFIILLFITLSFGKVVNGAKSWLGIGDFGIQPSEFAKISTIIFLAFYLQTIGSNIRKLRFFLIGLLIIMVPVGFIIIQPDMGTSLVYFPVFLTMAFLAGAKVRHIFFLILLTCCTTILTILPYLEEMIMGIQYPVFTILKKPEFLLFSLLGIGLIFAVSLWGLMIFKKRYFYWIIYGSSILAGSSICSFGAHMVLKDYQVMRLISFINPYIDPRGTGWNIIQSITAVGSGGVWGKGFLQGTQSHYQYLPQQSTDFIFSIIAEELGFFGGFIILVLYLVILLRGVQILSNTNDKFGLLLGSGILAMILFHLFVNIGMAMGIMPITGIPLLFLSYGGSSLWTALIGIGILLNLSFKQYR
ncbi:MAG: rod shape-determining protein RodA [Spirochaetales bacterium]|nr:rod shape-determining protein RodA [Spirochaetales bacterium]